MLVWIIAGSRRRCGSLPDCSAFTYRRRGEGEQILLDLSSQRRCGSLRDRGTGVDHCGIAPPVWIIAGLQRLDLQEKGRGGANLVGFSSRNAGADHCDRGADVDHCRIAAPSSTGEGKKGSKSVGFLVAALVWIIAGSRRRCDHCRIAAPSPTGEGKKGSKFCWISSRSAGFGSLPRRNGFTYRRTGREE